MKRRRSKATLHKDVLVKRGLSEQLLGDLALTEPLLGAFTLEGFGLGVDPVNRRLIPVPGLLKAVA